MRSVEALPLLCACSLVPGGNLSTGAGSNSASPPPPWVIARRVLRRAIVSFVEDRCTHMAAAISYALQEVPGTRRVLDEFRTSPKIDRLFEEGVELWTSDPATPR